MDKKFREQMLPAPAAAMGIVEQSMLGGDREVARVMPKVISFRGEITAERRFASLGAAAIFSMGATFVSLVI